MESVAADYLADLNTVELDIVSKTPRGSVINEKQVQEKPTQKPFFDCDKLRTSCDCDKLRTSCEPQYGYTYLALCGIFVIVPGTIALMIYLAYLIFERTGDLGATEAFLFTIGWVTVLPLMFCCALIVSCCGGTDYDNIRCGKKLECGPVVLWRYGWCYYVGICIVSLIVLIVGGVRLIPYLHFNNDVTYLTYNATPYFKDGFAFVWSDAIIDETHVEGYMYSNFTGRLCISCGRYCQKCDTIFYVVKTCAAPIVPLTGYQNLEQINAFAFCYWIPCRSYAYWESGNGNWTNNGNSWDHNCTANPDMSDCLTQCKYSHASITVYNNVVLGGKSWSSKYSQGIAFQQSYTGGVELQNSINSDAIIDPIENIIIPKLLEQTNRTGLKTTYGEYLHILWGDEPIVYYSSGIHVFLATSWTAILIFLPPSPLLLPQICGKRNDYFCFSITVRMFLWLFLTVVPFTVYFVNNSFPTET